MSSSRDVWTIVFGAGCFALGVIAALLVVTYPG